ncbi:hypothetical protein VOLCADRAFT_100173 [Volvox carteri f. nagariensis]|uniref:acylaminoacyl-peptidase n=1 Tax=Volvox carteri f. nagariensis TaxID=3068 RepID=D8UJL1_VOLCA|nr:uncharacterized protein VOLCADRAFT_100173 [Volvox carteri f. nagariensis]EFJ40104.1 hypothetical protein VOLCADRAFT_100173 [Volvox carteri f. nagariensis]|eukprot:XP_002958853.1 hypothetical protein VOLCADRAFT_100173 [Volvox carteri f. nagariensis]
MTPKPTTATAAAAAGATELTASAAAADLSTAPGGGGAAAAASSITSSSNGPSEQPSGMSSEAALLAAISEVPTLSRLVVRAANEDLGRGGGKGAAGGGGGGGITITDSPIVADPVGPFVPRVYCFVQATLQQRNLPANAQRRYNITAALTAVGDGTAMDSGTGGGGAAAVRALVGMPQELHADVQLVSVSPSGRTALERTPAWCGPESLKDAAGPRSWRGVGAAGEDWGELNTGKRPPAVYVLDVERREVVKPATSAPTTNGIASESLDDTTAITTTATTTGGGPNGLLMVAWPHKPPPSFPRLAASINCRKLGVVFCYNRSAHLYHVAVRRGADGVLQFGSWARRLAPSLESCLSPAFSPGGDVLCFVSHSEAVTTGTHGGTARLYRMDWSPQAGGPLTGPSADPELVVDVVERPAGHSAFPGLYTAAIPDDGFLGSETLLVNTQWGAVNAIVAMNIKAPEKGSPGADGSANGSDDMRAAAAMAVPVPLTPVSPGTALYGNWTLMGVAGGVAVASRVAPDAPAELYVAKLPADPASLTAADGSGGGSSLVWQPLELGAPPGYGSAGGGLREDLPPVVQETLDNLDFQVLRVTPPGPGVGDADTSAAFDCLIWLPKDRTGPVPAVLSPHGGPHTAVTLGWYPSFALLTRLGYAVLCPNYRGSTGYGQSALLSLPGRIGRQDVDDCMAALETAVQQGLVDPSRVSVVGGSHGGFLTAHLLGQHPGAFRCGVMRNPVTNISAMVAASDIPDWCYVEVLGSEEGCRRAAPVATPADLAAMYGASPVSYVDSVTAPVFMMLGARDRRVPPLDGLQYLSALRGRDVGAAGAAPPPPTRLIVFPEDSHGLDKPQTEFEQWINVVWWLKSYAGPEAAAEGARVHTQTTAVTQTGGFPSSR